MGGEGRGSTEAVRDGLRGASSNGEALDEFVFDVVLLVFLFHLLGQHEDIREEEQIAIFGSFGLSLLLQYHPFLDQLSGWLNEGLKIPRKYLKDATHRVGESSIRLCIRGFVWRV